MSKASQFVILCEDQLQEVCIYRFLKKWLGHKFRYRVPQYPASGGGSGEQFVRNEYAKELKAFRKRSASTVLIVMIDADNGTVQNRHNQLDSSAEADGLQARQDGEAILHAIPKWHIETWLAWMDGQDVNENDDYKGEYEFKSIIDRFASQCKNRSDLSNPPDSLTQACREFKERIRPELA